VAYFSASSAISAYSAFYQAFGEPSFPKSHTLRFFPDRAFNRFGRGVFDDDLHLLLWKQKSLPGVAAGQAIG
jgi:hypothetical protein